MLLIYAIAFFILQALSLLHKYCLSKTNQIPQSQVMQPNPPFALILPGTGPITNFSFDNNIFHTDIINPSSISNICLSLTQTLPPDFAIALYFSQPPYTQMQYLGAVSNNRPSDIFQTGFPLIQQFSTLPSIKICLRPQPFAQLKDLVMVDNGRKEYTRLVAQNLYNFMMSYHKDDLLKHGIQGDFLVVPNNFLTKWIQKFDQKYAKDPNFILKTTTN